MNSPTIAAPPPRKHRNLAQGVVAHIADSIRQGSLNPGEKLPTESEIMRLHGVSRTVVREAISHMQASGMVQTRHGIGTFVLAPAPAPSLGIDPGTVVTMRDVLAILELRISLETEAAGLAAQRRETQHLQAMHEALQAFERNFSAGHETVSHDLAFHLSIAQATGNRYFQDILQHFGQMLIPRNRIASIDKPARDPDYLRRVNREHEEIYAAIERQDADSARAAMRIHLTNSRERLRLAQRHSQASGSATPQA